MSSKCDVMLVFAIWGHFGTVWRHYCERLVVMTYPFPKTIYLSTRNQKQNYEKLTTTVFSPVIEWSKVILVDFFNFGSKKSWRHHFLRDKVIKLYISGMYWW